jgi:citronellyl-CoA synthetase
MVFPTDSHFWIDRKINRIDMSQTTQTDIITLSDVATRLPNFITKYLISSMVLNRLICGRLLPTGLGIAFEKAVKRNPQGIALII